MIYKGIAKPYELLSPASQAAWRAENDAMRERGLAYRDDTMDGFMGAHIEKEYAWMMEARWHEKV